jgi:monooxygenase
VTEHVDVVIVGAGLSGIGAAAQLTRSGRGGSYVVLESRAASGGTWDLFRYPGVRSDSDMYTLGYRFRPWTGEKALADGASILAYVRETAREYGVDAHVRYEHRVTAASWDSDAARWTLTVQTPDGPRPMSCRFLWSCAGYYDYDAGHRPRLPGEEAYRGTWVHPQQWPEDLDVSGQRVVVVGSGATAVTLVPALVDEGAAHVTMLQRSPTYVLPVPAVDGLSARLRRRLPAGAAYRAVRWKNVLVQSVLYRVSRRAPGLARRLLRAANVRHLPEGYDVDTHFRPRYDVWDQRLCLVPDGDLFAAIGRGRAEVVTDTIDTMTADGVRVASGRELAADVVVTATGLRVLPFGGVAMTVDGEEVRLPERMAYRALMLSGVPNFAYTVGYTNASWTLKADLVAEYVCRLLDHLDEHGQRWVVPVADPDVEPRPFLDFNAGYVQRALPMLPVQGHREPWKLRQSYWHDVRAIRRGRIDDGVLRFG